MSPGALARERVRAAFAAAVLAVGALALAGCGQVKGTGSERLAVEAPRWWFTLIPVRIVATPRGALAGREMTLTVAVGSNVAGRWDAKGKPLAIWIPGANFRAGANRILVKTGSERTEVGVQSISFVWLAMPLAIALMLAGALFSRWRRARRASPEAR